jgi:hypothetical protein
LLLSCSRQISNFSGTELQQAYTNVKLVWMEDYETIAKAHENDKIVMPGFDHELIIILHKLSFRPR